MIRFAGEEIRSLPVRSCAAGWAMPFNLLACFPTGRGAKHRYRAAITKMVTGADRDRIDELMALLGLEPNLRERFHISFPVVSSNVWEWRAHWLRSASLTDG